MMVNKLWTVCFMICISLSISVDVDEDGFCIKNIIVQKTVTKSRIVRKGWFNREVTEYYNELVNAPKQEKDCCEGFVRNGPYCDPHCDGTCENGKCIGNNVCECYQGYMKFSASLCILECPNCDYGNCIGPEKCDCYDGYTKSDEGTCVPQCNPPCVNVECIAPNKC